MSNDELNYSDMNWCKETIESLHQQLAECQRELRHWKGRGTMGQIAKWRSDSEQLATVTKQRDELAVALKLVLPMAKGYAAEHPVGRNSEYCLDAEAALAKVGAGNTGDKT